MTFHFIFFVHVIDAIQTKILLVTVVKMSTTLLNSQQKFWGILKIKNIYKLYFMYNFILILTQLKTLQRIKNSYE